MRTDSYLNKHARLPSRVTERALSGGRALLSNDLILPEQFQNPELVYKKAPGEAALLRAVLEDAITCFRQYATAPGRRAQRLAREAEEWLFTDDPRWPMSFTNVCAALGLDPDYLRMKLRQWCQRPPVSPGQEAKRSKVVKQRLSRIAP